VDLLARVTIAAFDVDGTITRRDSTAAFCLARVPPWRLLPGLALGAPRLLGLRLGLVPRQRAKETVLTAFFRGVEEEELRRRAAAWSVRELPRLVRPSALERIRWHQSQGHRVLLVSASLDVVLEPWARTLGIEDVLATRLEVRDGRLTGRIEGRNCYGEEKVRRLRALLGDLTDVELYAYGDSRGDREMLDVAQHPMYRPFHQG
jgi:HAD superfamily hydrolase (TIGR01490 family)